MMNNIMSEVIYTGDLSTTAKHLKSGVVITTDAPTDNRGKGEAFSPTDLMSASLASCMLTIMGIVAMDHKIDMTGTRAEVHKFMSNEGPRKVIKIKIDVFMPDKTFTRKEKGILSKAAQTCPVGRSLDPALIQDIKLHWFDDSPQP